MSPFSASLRLLGFAAVLSLVGLIAAPAWSQRPTKKRFDQRRKDDLATRKAVPLPKLDTVGERRGNVVEVPLTVSIEEHTIDRDDKGTEKDRVRTRSYNMKLCGPVIRVKPGDLLKVRLKNDIKRSVKDKDYDPANPTAPYGFNVTNLHTHGLNVSPSGRSDNVFLEVGPEEYIDLCFDIPKDHPAGTFWYHAHKHGSVAMQLAGGMAGVLIVDGGEGSLDAVPQIKAATAKEHEKILVFQQVPYRSDPTGAVVDILEEDVYGDPAVKSALAADNTLVRNTLINGELFPKIKMRPGEVQRWRCVHAGLETTLDLALAEKTKDAAQKANRVPLYEIAVDGLPLGTLKEWTHIELQPGYRSDLLVKAPAAGTYYLQTLSVPAGRSIGRVRQDPRYLAEVVVEGPPMQKDMELPREEALKEYRLPSVKNAAPRPDPVSFYSYDAGKEYFVNDKPFSEDQVPLRAKLETKEEWVLESQGGNHPFHIHVNPFEVYRKDEHGNQELVWRDTVLVTPGRMKIWTEYKKFPGKTVLHCHNLRHEDQGMMAAFEIAGAAPASRCPNPPKVGFATLPADAPRWELPDAEGKVHKSVSYAGKKLLMVFSRGYQCLHCRGQVQALVAKEKELADAGLTVVVVCPVSAAKLPAKASLPFLVLSDEAAVAFKAYRCHDGRALHGVFLIDSEGKVRWNEGGDDPYMDVSALVSEAKKIK